MSMRRASGDGAPHDRRHTACRVHKSIACHCAMLYIESILYGGGPISHTPQGESLFHRKQYSSAQTTSRRQAANKQAASQDECRVRSMIQATQQVRNNQATLPHVTSSSRIRSTHAHLGRILLTLSNMISVAVTASTAIAIAAPLTPLTH